MVLNKKGQVIFVVLMLAIMLFIGAVAVSKPIVDVTNNVMNVSNLDCSNSTITKYEKATCTIVDMGAFYFIGTLIAMSIAFISGKKNITGVLTAIMAFIVVVVLISPLKDFIIFFRDSSHLNCASTSIVGIKLTCIFVDLWLFYFVVVAITAAVILIFVKKVLK